MSRSYSRVRADGVTGNRRRDGAMPFERVERPIRHRIDSNAVRWVFAGTVAFWLAVYVAGRSFFF